MERVAFPLKAPFGLVLFDSVECALHVGRFRLLVLFICEIFMGQLSP